jgi:hypothetical protein
MPFLRLEPLMCDVSYEPNPLLGLLYRYTEAPQGLAHLLSALDAQPALLPSPYKYLKRVKKSPEGHIWLLVGLYVPQRMQKDKDECAQISEWIQKCIIEFHTCLVPHSTTFVNFFEFS